MANIIASGDWWRLEDDGTLYVFCVGDMPSREWGGDYIDDITSVVIADSVTSVGYGTFGYYGNLASVTIGDGVTVIYSNAFSYCPVLSSVTIGDSVDEIQERAFAYCTSLTSVTIPDSVTNIGWGVFYGCTALTSVTIPNGVVYIGDSAFNGCSSLTGVTIPASVTSIGTSAFEECSSLTSVAIPNSVTSVADRAFCGCVGLTSVTIGNGSNYIAEQTFSGCTGLTSVIIPNGVTDIGYEAFSGCSGLESVTIPASVRLIDGNVFDGCSSLSDVYYGSTEEWWDGIDISGGNEPLENATIHYSLTPQKTLESIAVTTPPIKTAYVSGETFDPAGMVVTATYSDATTAVVTGYSLSPTTPLRTGDAVITISYTEGDVTATAYVTIGTRRAPDFTLVFNGYDFAPKVSTYAVKYETEYRKVVTALNGTRYSSNGMRRPIVNFSLFPMTDAEAKAVYDALKIMIAACTYTDKATNTDRTAQFRLTSNLEYAFALRSVDGNRYYKGGMITLEGVTCIA